MINGIPIPSTWLIIRDKTLKGPTSTWMAAPWGLVLRPLGAINATFYALEQEGGAFSARLHFNTSDMEPKR